MRIMYYMDPEPTDEKLVEMSLQNQAFFAILVNRYEEKLFRYIQRRTNISDKEVEDLLQEIFIKIYVHLNAFDSSLQFSSWVYRIAHNEIISNHRKKQSRPQHDMVHNDDSVFEYIASDIDIEESFIQKEDQDKLRDVVNMLPEKYREVLMLKFFEEQDYDSISDILQIPPGTVATRINRAKKKLKELL